MFGLANIAKLVGSKPNIEIITLDDHLLALFNTLCVLTCIE